MRDTILALMIGTIPNSICVVLIYMYMYKHIPCTFNKLTVNHFIYTCNYSHTNNCIQITQTKRIIIYIYMYMYIMS